MASFMNSNCYTIDGVSVIFPKQYKETLHEGLQYYQKYLCIRFAKHLRKQARWNEIATTGCMQVFVKSIGKDTKNGKCYLSCIVARRDTKEMLSDEKWYIDPYNFEFHEHDSYVRRYDFLNIIGDERFKVVFYDTWGWLSISMTMYWLRRLYETGFETLQDMVGILKEAGKNEVSVKIIRPLHYSATDGEPHTTIRIGEKEYNLYIHRAKFLVCNASNVSNE